MLFSYLRHLFDESNRARLIHTISLMCNTYRKVTVQLGSKPTKRPFCDTYERLLESGYLQHVQRKEKKSANKNLLVFCYQIIIKTSGVE